MQTSTVLAKAKDVLVGTGWCKGQMVRGKKGGVTHACALGSLHLAVGGRVEWVPSPALGGGFWEEQILTPPQRTTFGNAKAALEAAATVVFPDIRHLSVASINDRFSTTKADVLGWFDAAIAAAKVQESRARRAPKVLV